LLPLLPLLSLSLQLAFCSTPADVWWLMLWCDSALDNALPLSLPLSLEGRLTAASVPINAWLLPFPLPLPDELADLVQVLRTLLGKWGWDWQEQGGRTRKKKRRSSIIKTRNNAQCLML